MKQFKKVLVANRGEIALRIMRSLKEMGIVTVAVYSDADRHAPHVQFADEAVYLGAPPSTESYLKQNAIIKACKDLNVDAIHPGYGFLSENATFAELVEKSGIAFIGPSAHAIRVMGSKLAAKEAVKKYNIPLVPGTDHAISDPKEAIQVANDVGFPILIKASAGGGGKGMRLVENADEIEEQIRSAISEAEAAFGDGSVFIEKFVSNPRHIEFQVMGDLQGHVIHLFERECSIQRRHQKVVEEAPSCVLTEEKRNEMGDAAVKVAKACGYYGAGTVEFMLDEHHNFYFLEMNTRLQVEHPVTELITGLDLVKMQVKIAEGASIPYAQEEVSIRGHAIELRVCAEDPHNHFLPDSGPLLFYKRPQGPGVRVDDGFDEGMDVPIYYDPMISKLIVYGHNRQEAIDRMVRAIDEYHITGVASTLDFGKFVMQHPNFISGDFNTKFIDLHFDPEKLNGGDNEDTAYAAAIGAMTLLNESRSNEVKYSSNGKKTSFWRLRART